MTPDEFARAAYPLLHEGIALLRAHAGEGPAIERYCATVEKVRAQYRAAKEAPAPDVAPPGFRIVGRSGPGEQGATGEVLAGSPGWTGQAIAPLLRPAQDAIDQADAIKAAVADERKRCLAWVNERDVLSREDWLTGIESGEDAPGAVGK